MFLGIIKSNSLRNDYIRFKREDLVWKSLRIQMREYKTDVKSGAPKRHETR